MKVNTVIIVPVLLSTTVPFVSVKLIYVKKVL